MTDKLHEAIVKAALERAAQTVQMCIWGDHWRHDDFGDVDPEELAEFIRSLASNPAEVAAIISAAAKFNKEQRDEKDQG
jgi:hypothetical protein